MPVIEPLASVTDPTNSILASIATVPPATLSVPESFNRLAKVDPNCKVPPLTLTVGEPLMVPVRLTVPALMVVVPV